MRHYGDITKLSGYELPVVDVITGGSPCQDLSLAGKRAGLAGERSGLFMEQMRIVKEMRERDRNLGRTACAVRPRYMVWENVPGAFSSGNPKGSDFAAVIEEIIKVAEPGADVCVCVPERGWTKSGCYYAENGSWSIAWRVHDAQFWGVPQRRKRIALVADFGGLTAPEILFERKGLSWDFEPSGTAREETAGAVGSGIEGASKCLNGWDVQSKHIQPADGIAEALYAGDCRYGGGESYVMETIGGVESASVGVDHVITTGGNCTAQGPCVYEEVEPTLKAGGPHAVFSTISFQERGGKPGGGKGILIQNERTGALSTLNNQSVCVGVDAYNQEITGAVSATLNATSGVSPTHSGPSVMVYGMSSYSSNSMKSGNPKSGIYEADTSRTLDLNGGNPACNQGGMLVLECNGSRQSHRGDGYSESETMYTLNSTEHHAVCSSVYSMGHDIRSAKFTDDEITDPLTATDYKDPIKISTYQRVTGCLDCGIAKGTGNQLANQDMFVANTSIVRRLTPMECERLQGFPDGWTDIGEWTDSKGKKHKEADSPRYKALGNSIAMPFWEWLARRICAQYERPVKMSSLFDGIGGFPLAFSKCGGVPVWASEIEEFPIAVTKKHFPEEAET